MASLSLLLLLASGAAESVRDPGEARAQAKVLLDKGSEEFAQHRFQAALDDFTAAYELDPVAGFLFNIGQCHRALHHWKRAATAFERYLAEKPNAKNAADVRDLIADVQGRDVAPRPAADVPAASQNAPAFSNVVLFQPLTDPGDKPWVTAGVGGGALLVAATLGAIALGLADQDHTVQVGIYTQHSISQSQATAANTLASLAVPFLVGGILTAGVGLIWEAVWHRQSESAL